MPDLENDPKTQYSSELEDDKTMAEVDIAVDPIVNSRDEGLVQVSVKTSQSSSLRVTLAVEAPTHHAPTKGLEARNQKRTT